MDQFAYNPIALYTVLALVVLWYLPTWGRMVLDFLRDLREFRAGR